MNSSEDLLEKYMLEAQSEPTDDRWMLTFADLLSLILTFFVLLYSMSEVDIDEWNKISRSLAQKLNPSTVVEATPPAAETNITRINIKPDATNLGYYWSIVLQSIKDSALLKNALIVSDLDNRLALSIDESLLFKEGTDTLSHNGEIFLDEISTILLPLKNKLDIYGNSANKANLLQNTNTLWNLALNRAIVTSERLRNNGYPYNITPYGRANSSFNALTTISDKQKQRLQTTIDIVIRAYKAKK